MTPVELIAPTTAGATSAIFKVGKGGSLSVQISGAAAVLAGAETATIHYLDSSGTYRAMVDAVNGAAQITAGETTITLNKAGTYKVVLSATAALTGIDIVDCN